MTLDEITSQAQMRRAIKADDADLLHEIYDELEKAIDRMEITEPSAVETAEDFFDMKIKPYFEEQKNALDLLGIMDLDPGVEEHLRRLYPEEPETPTGEERADGPRLKIEPLSKILKETVLKDTDPDHPFGPDLFQIDTDLRGRGARGLEVGTIYYEDVLQLDEPLSWVPWRVMEGLLNQIRSDYDWQQIDDETWSTGWIDGGDIVVVSVRPGVDENEWAQDRIREYYVDLVNFAPDLMVARFEEYLKNGHPELYRKLRKAKLPKKVRESLAVALFEDIDDPAIGLEVISQTLGVFDYEGSRGEVLTVVTRDDLRDMGITSGRWWDGAPWRLYNLPPNEFPYEGTLMRHCVGRIDMGYQDAAENGRIQIWSLRSKFNIPVLTWEIDLPVWERTQVAPEENMTERGRAILQLKGKVNRRPPRDEDERAVLLELFDRLAVDPKAVEDFAGRISNGRSFDHPVAWRSIYA